MVPGFTRVLSGLSLTTLALLLSLPIAYALSRTRRRYTYSVLACSLVLLISSSSIINGLQGRTTSPVWGYLWVLVAPPLVLVLALSVIERVAGGTRGEAVFKEKLLRASTIVYVVHSMVLLAASAIPDVDINEFYYSISMVTVVPLTVYILMLIGLLVAKLYWHGGDRREALYWVPNLMLPILNIIPVVYLSDVWMHIVRRWLEDLLGGWHALFTLQAYIISVVLAVRYTFPKLRPWIGSINGDARMRARAFQSMSALKKSMSYLIAYMIVAPALILLGVLAGLPPLVLFIAATATMTIGSILAVIPYSSVRFGISPKRGDHGYLYEVDCSIHGGGSKAGLWDYNELFARAIRASIMLILLVPALSIAFSTVYLIPSHSTLHQTIGFPAIASSLIASLGQIYLALQVATKRIPLTPPLSDDVVLLGPPYIASVGALAYDLLCTLLELAYITDRRGDPHASLQLHLLEEELKKLGLKAPAKIKGVIGGGVGVEYIIQNGGQPAPYEATPHTLRPS